jgi:hypothetical protein
VKDPPAALAEPRSFAGMAFRLGAMAYLPFALGVPWLVSTLFGLPFALVLPFGLGGGLVFSTVYGLSNARFLQAETLTVEVADARDFVARRNVAASQLGYYPAAGAGDFHAYRPSFQTGWAAGWISVQLAGGQAVVVGPRVFVRRLLARLAAR